jgi:hypothetical protein
MRCTGWLGVAAVVVLGACTSDSGSPAVQSIPSSASAPASASANVTVQGDAALTSAFAQPDVRCSFPDVGGPSIALLSTPPGLVFRIKVQQSKVTVLVNDNASPTANERDFAGTGVTTFDAGGGAQIDSTLTEIPAESGAPPGSIGQLTAIKAFVDCAGQDPGRSTVTLTGDTPQGTLTNATFGTARVECNPSGNEVILIGIVNVAGSDTFVDVGLRTDAVSVNKAVTGGNNSYLSSPGAATVTDTGAQVNGDATEQGGTGSHVLHVEGEATCGTPVS